MFSISLRTLLLASRSTGEIVTKASDVHHLCHPDVEPLSPWLGCALRLAREKGKTKRKNVLP